MVVVTPSGPYQSSVQCGQTGRRVIWPSEERKDGVAEELEQRSGGVAEEVALVAWCGLTAGRAGREWERMGGGASIRGWGGGREDRHPHPPYNLWKGGAGGLRRGRSRPPSTCLLPPPVSLLYMSLIPPPVPFFHLSHHPILERRSNVLRLPAPPVLTLTNTQKLHIFTHLDSLTPSGPP